MLVRTTKPRCLTYRSVCAGCVRVRARVTRRSHHDFAPNLNFWPSCEPRACVLVPLRCMRLRVVWGWVAAHGGPARSHGPEHACAVSHTLDVVVATVADARRRARVCKLEVTLSTHAHATCVCRRAYGACVHPANAGCCGQRSSRRCSTYSDDARSSVTHDRVRALCDAMRW